MSLRTRIITIFVVIVLLVVFALSRIAYLTVREIYLNQMADQVDLLSRTITSDLNTSYLDLLVFGASDVQANLYYREKISDRLLQSGLEEAVILNKNMTIKLHIGHSLEAFQPLAAITLNRQEIENLKAGESFSSRPFKSGEGSWYLWGFYRINSDYFLGIREQASRLARVDELSRIFWLVGSGALLITLLAGWIMARIISRPIDHLVSFSRELGKGNFDTPAPHPTYNELRILSGAMDKMRTDLSARNREKEEMLAQIAHELRNPLGGMELLVGLITEDLSKANMDLSYSEKIQGELGKLKNLVNEYLHYSKPVQTRPEMVNLKDLLEEIRLSLNRGLVDKQINIIYEDGERYIWFDPGHLRQILMNLIANSIEASPKLGVIRISAEESDKRILIEVQDEGGGLEAGDETKVFEPFFSKKENGTGLGLAISRKLCLENQAEIWATNNADKGCTFFISVNRNNVEQKIERT